MAKKKQEEMSKLPERREENDRRDSADRRENDAPVAENRRTSPRRKVQRRRQIDPTTCERDYSVDEIEFMGALDDYKRSSGRMFPTCSEVLEVLRDLGYRKEHCEQEHSEEAPAEVEEQTATPEPAGV